MKKIRSGVVISNKMDKTVVVKIGRTLRHPVYKKVVRASSKFKAHDEKNQCQIGDLVEIIETRPISSDKRWRVSRILGRAKIKAQEYPKGEEEKIDTAAQ